MAALMQRRILGAKLQTSEDYIADDDAEIKELAAMTGVKYKAPARKLQPKRCAAPPLMSLGEMEELAAEAGSPVQRRPLTAPETPPDLGDVWWNTHREEEDESITRSPTRRAPPRPASASSSTTSRRRQKAASAAFVASASTAAVTANRQAVVRKKIRKKDAAPRRRTPDASATGPRRGRTPDASAATGPRRRRTPDAAIPGPGDPYCRKTPDATQNPPDAAAPRVVSTARRAAAVALPRPRSQPRTLPSLMSAPAADFDLFAWPGEAPAGNELGLVAL